LFFDHPDYLGFGKTALSHLFAPSKVEQTLYQSEGSFGGQVIINAEVVHFHILPSEV